MDLVATHFRTLLSYLIKHI